MKKFVICFLISNLIPMMGFPQFSIRGKVTDEEDRPLTGAHIILQKTYKSTVSDDNGEYSLTRIPEGKYSMKVSFIGHETVVKNIHLSKDTTIIFTLETKAYIGDEVIITAIRADKKSPTTYENVDFEEIEKINMGQDLPYLIDQSPSTVITSDAGTGIGYTGIRIRGSDITRLNVTINGIPLNDPESQGVFWVDMPDIASSIDNIQIQRGVGTSTNGAAAFGGSINIQTTTLQPDPYGIVNSNAGSFNTFKNNVAFGTGLIKGKWSFDGRLSKISSDGYIDRAFADLKSFYFSGGYYGEKSMLKAVIFSGKERTYQAWGGVPKDSLETNRTYNPYTYENETDNYQQDHYQLHYTYQFNKNLHLNTSLFLIHGEGYYEQYKEAQAYVDYQLPDVEIGDTLITATDMIRQKWLKNDYYGLTYSLKYNKNKTNLIIGGSWNRFDGDHFGEVIWAAYASNMEKDYQWYDNTGIKTDFNIFGKMNYQITDKINIYGDLQYRNVDYKIDGIHDDLRDISQNHTFNFFNPKAGLLFDLTKNQSLYFSFAVANREPNRSNYRDADEGYQPKAERLYDYEVGYKYTHPRYGLEANLYFMDYKDQLVLTGEINDVGAAIMTNVPDSYRAGIELMAGVQIFKFLKWDVNATFSRNKVRDFTEFIDNWSPPYEQKKNHLGATDLSFSPEIVAGSMINYQSAIGLEISLNSKYVSRQYIDNTSSESRSLNPYFINDLVINYTFKTNFIREIGLNLMINNLFDIEYETYAWVYRYYYKGAYYEMDGYFPQAGINVMGGISLSF